jgi:uncharacterized protein (TIGR03083 family)
MADIWPVVLTERASLVEELEGLRDEQWDTPSLCDRWTVRDVVAHMTATARITPGSFFPKLVGAGFSLRRLQAKDIVTQRGSSPAETLAHFKSVASSTTGPPGPKETMLGETLVHAEDVRRPLGIAHGYPVDALVATTDFYKGSNLVLGTKRRIDGLGLDATDAAWSHGVGPLVSGPILDLVLAMTGRTAGLDRLEGDGVAVLRDRAS